MTTPFLFVVVREKRVRVAFFLAVCVASLMMITYSGRVDSGDELRLLDASSSLVRFGDLYYDESFWYNLPNNIYETSVLPLQPAPPDETLSTVFISVFYRMADSLEGVGLAHVTWLYNVLVVVLIALTFFALATTLGYSVLVGAIGAFLLVTVTALGVYSRWLFREPTVALFLLLTTWALLRARLTPRWGGRLFWWGSAFISLSVAFGIKESALLAVPALLVWGLPVPMQSRLWGRLFDGVIVFATVGTLLFIAVTPLHEGVNGFLGQVLAWDSSRFLYTQTALHTYLLSIGGSFWATSPILLLGTWGAWRLRQQGQSRVIVFAILAVLGYAFGHAYLTGVHWFGGLSWIPRFLMPTVPIAFLTVLPVLVDVLEKRRTWQIMLVGCVIGYSAFVTLVGNASFLLPYVSLLPDEAQGLGEWGGGLNDIRYLRWVLLPQLWGSLGLDFAWYRADLPFWAMANAFLAVLSIGMGWLSLRWHSRRAWGAIFTLCVGWVIVNGAGLRDLFLRDNDYQAQRVGLHEALAILEQEAQIGDFLLLPNQEADDFILNTLRVEGLRSITLPNQPGDAFSLIAPPQITSHRTAELLTEKSLLTIDTLARHHPRLWLLTTQSAFLEWAVRPVERYLTENYALVQSFSTSDPLVRVLLFETTLYPAPRAMIRPEIQTDLRFGANIRLSGVTLPNGIHYQPGDMVNVAFYWQTDALIEQEVIVGWFVSPITRDRPPIQGMDSAPQNGFASTLTWEIGVPVWDKRALRLPSDLPSGDYEVWVLMYQFVDGSPQRLIASGERTLEGTIGILPVTLVVGN